MADRYEAERLGRERDKSQPANSPKADLLRLDSIDLSKDDVLAIAVSRAEDMLVSTRREQDGIAKATEAQIAQRTKALEALAISKAQVDFAPKATALIVAMDALNGPKTDIIYSVNLDASRGQKLETTATIKTQNQHACYAVTLGETKYPFAAEMLAEFQAIETLKQDLAVARGLALDARKRLTEIPMLERKWKGRLAEARLAKVEGGAEIVELLTKDLTETVLALPGI